MTRYAKHQSLDNTVVSLFEPSTLKVYAYYPFAGDPWSVGGRLQANGGIPDSDVAGPGNRVVRLFWRYQLDTDPLMKSLREAMPWNWRQINQAYLEKYSFNTVTIRPAANPSP